LRSAGISDQVTLAGSDSRPPYSMNLANAIATTFDRLK
jgi:hypothetical protein